MKIPSSEVRALSARLALRALQPNPDKSARDTVVASQKTDSRSSTEVSPAISKLGSSLSSFGISHDNPSYIGFPGVSSAYNEIITTIPRHDTGSSSFREYFGNILRGIANSDESNSVNSEIVEAFEAGELSVENCAVDAWDVTFVDKAGNNMGNGYISDTDTWWGILRSKIQNNADGSPEISGAGTYVDRSTGNKAAWMSVDGNHYYLTWPAK